MRLTRVYETSETLGVCSETSWNVRVGGRLSAIPTGDAQEEEELSGKDVSSDLDK